MELLALIIADLALGAIAWRLGKKNEESNKQMAAAVVEMSKAVDEMKTMNMNTVRRLDSLEARVDNLTMFEN